MCCVNSRTVKEQEVARTGKCPECDNDIDNDGDTVEHDDCSYSPLLCDKCGYRPCDQSC